MSVAHAHQREVGTDWRALLRHLRAVLSPDSNKPLSQEKMGQLLDVSWRTVARWESEAAPAGRNATKVQNLGHAVDLLGNMLERKDRVTFFASPHRLLLNLRPITLLESDEGAALVFEQIEGAASGAFA